MLQPPTYDGYTIYSKSNCPFCVKIKDFLEREKCKMVIVDCDELLKNNRDEFLKEMKDYTKVEWKTFPYVFLDGNFIGGYQDTINKMVLDEDF
jgi:glutaredoxin